VGVVPTAGVVPVSHSQDSPGPLGRRASDVAVLFEVVASMTGVAERLTAGGNGLRIGVARNWRTGHPATDALFEQAVDRIRGCGAELVDVSPAVPTDEVHADEVTVLLCELKEGMDRYMGSRGPGGPQTLAEVVAYEDAHAEIEQPYFGHELFEQALDLGGCDSDRYREARARNLAWALQTCLEPAMSGVDLMVSATYGPAWKSDLILGGHPAASSPATTAPAIAGWPIATVPMGLAEGLPVGLGIIGRPGSEAVMLALGAAVEQPARPTWIDPKRG
jgi:amidase